MQARHIPHPALLAAGSGLLLGLSFEPFPFPGLAWVALVPLLVVWQRAERAGEGFRWAFLAFLVTFAVAFSWPLLHPMATAAWASLSGVLLLPLLMALPVAAAVSVRRRLGLGYGLMAFVAFFLLMEAALSRGPLAFPWALLGHTQSSVPGVRQLAALAGTPGLSLLVLLANVAAWNAWRARSRRRRAAPLAAFALLTAGAAGLGVLSRPEPLRPGDALRIGVVQPAIPALAWAALGDTSRVTHLLHLSETLEGNPDLVVWPETALPPVPGLPEQVAAWARRRGTALLTGVILPDGGGTGLFTNSALLFASGAPAQRYDKVRLVPFAEQVPFASLFPPLDRLSVPAGGVRGYQAGQPGPPLRLGRARLGVLICFESAFGNYARRSVEQGANLLVVLTQDGWWGRSPGYRQHLALARLRAIETRRALVHVAATGTTALILPDGTPAFEVPWMEPAARLAQAPLSDVTSPFVRYGDLASLLALVVSVVLMIRLLVSRLRPTVLGVLLLSLVGAAACDSAETPDLESVPSFSGSWQAMVTAGDAEYTLRLSLTEANTSIGGVGTLVSPQRTIDVAVKPNSTYAHPDLSLEINDQIPANAFRPIRVLCRVNEARTRCTGTITGGDIFSGEALTLEKV